MLVCQSLYMGLSSAPKVFLDILERHNNNIKDSKFEMDTNRPTQPEIKTEKEFFSLSKNPIFPHDGRHIDST